MEFFKHMEPAEKAEAIAAFASVFEAAGMIAVALASGSVSVLAEGIDTCVDIVASVAVMIGLKLSKRHSKDFPDGLYKLENIVAVAIAIPLSPVGRYLGFTALPGLYWPLIGATLLCYVLLTQGVKMWLLRHRWI